jgi:hypothetical protein
VSLSAVIGGSLTLDVGRTSIIALSVLILTGGVKLLWTWLMKSARDDFRDSIGKVVDNKIGNLEESLVTMANDLGELAQALKAEREERTDLRKLIIESIDEVERSQTEAMKEREDLRKLVIDSTEGLTKANVVTTATLVIHGSWIEQIAAGAGIELDVP